MSAGTVAFVALASSVASVGALELLRGPRAGSPPALAVEPPPETSAARAPRPVEPHPPAPGALDRSTGHEDRLAELERRVAALELGATSRRAPASPATDEPSPADDLRDLVLGWVAEEREARARAEEVDGAEQERKQLEFTASHQALLLAQEHDLADWQEQRLFELFLEIETRRLEVGKDMNPRSADPQEFERRWTEFDEWADRRYVEVLEVELFEQLFGEQ